ncbi:hypothetical protein ERICII_04155 (plasmid) [Paenibacillus larvae subsp. larvae DSM 25430]|uniref:Uncharacterized protein n=1 Tax=Paenibacillus larvae subsp. larvae DSM 25430 TaxID=697284 RepID=V9W9X0_9BACL|nr:hypothetical protein ERIC2_10p00120 [Paenibacillus larvae subsp. larvae DSM 25430]AVG14383.1 hypothetical protein ERICII_04155 [Paenibacillus larvae subsp. larvae DSM 25430]
MVTVNEISIFFSLVLNAFGDVLFYAFSAMIAFSVGYYVKRLLVE